jgi:hypothetical protein
LAQAPEPSLFHRALILSNELQKLSPFIVAASFVFNSVVASIFWLLHGDFLPALLVALGVMVASLINWALLHRLPQQKRSFGPDQPSALALSAVTALTAALFGLLGVSVGMTLLMVAAISALAYYATWIEPFALTLTREQLTAPEWQGEGVCLRLMHIADIHVDSRSPRQKQINDMVASL